MTLPAQAETPDKTKQLEQKILELEQQQQELSARQNEMYVNIVESNSKINTFLDKKVSLGGFFESSIVNLSGPDMVTQTSTSSHLFGLNIAAELGERFNFVSQLITVITYPLQNPHNNPNVTPTKRTFNSFALGTIVAQSYIESTVSSKLKIQTGIGYVPFGYAYQQRDLFLFERRGGPQLTNASNTTTVGMAFPLWMGIHILGTFDVSKVSRWGYNFYSFSPSLKPSTIGGGTRFWWMPDDGVIVGVSGQTGQNISDTYYVYGADLDFHKDQFGFTMEYARNISSDKELQTPESYYIEPHYTFPNNEWLIYGVADYLSFPNLKTGAAQTDDPFQKWIYGAGLNWMPLPVARFRLGLLSHNYIGSTSSINGQQRNYFAVDFSCGVAF